MNGLKDIEINVNDIFGEKKKEYNDIPVAFCPRCLSLKIRRTSENEDYCDECGESNIKYTSIEVWMDKAREEFGNNFVIENKYGRI